MDIIEFEYLHVKELKCTIEKTKGIEENGKDTSMPKSVFESRIISNKKAEEQEL